MTTPWWAIPVTRATWLRTRALSNIRVWGTLCPLQFPSPLPWSENTQETWGCDQQRQRLATSPSRSLLGKEGLFPPHFTPPRNPTPVSGSLQERTRHQAAGAAGQTCESVIPPLQTLSLLNADASGKPIQQNQALDCLCHWGWHVTQTDWTESFDRRWLDLWGVRAAV